MINIRRFSFSLATLLLVTVIVALTISHFLQWRRLKAVQNELDEYHSTYGHLDIGDRTRIYIVKSPGNGRNWHNLYLPSMYKFHFTEMTIPDEGPPTELIPTTTIEGRQWLSGRKISMRWGTVRDGPNVRRFEVESTVGLYLDYYDQDFQADKSTVVGSDYFIEQRSFPADETIQLMWFRDSVTKRGGVLWMEPIEKWRAREKAKQQTNDSKAK